MSDTHGDPPDQLTGSAPPPSPTPPRGPRVLRGLAWLLAALVLVWIGRAWGDVILRPVDRLRAGLTASESPAVEGTDADGKRTFYTCGMHPWVILPEPGDCPVCHMKLTPLDPGKFTGEITIDPVMTQNIGVRVAPVVSGPLTRTLRAVGKVDYDETAVRDVNTRFEGWMETLYVDYVGARVEAGQPLFDVFSRELYSAQEEYLIAFRAASRGAPTPDLLPELERDTRRNLDAARQRLILLGITTEQIERLEREGAVAPTMTILSPWSGLVTEKHAFEGMRFTPGMLTYRVADLSRVWVFVTLYEYQLPFVQEGQKAVMTLPYVPGQRFEGKVAYVYPWLEERTREVRVRLEFDNPGLHLKPGMFATVELTGRLAEERTLAPREAVIDTGEREVAFVSKGGGKFEPREVRTGVQAEDGQVEILSGLRPGELVVTSGQFLLDSEARLREALAKMIRGDLASDQERGAVLRGPSELASLPAGMARDLATLLDGSFRIGEALASDRLDGVPDAARAAAAAVDGLLAREVPGHPHFWHQHEEVARIRGEALELAGATDLPRARSAYGELSNALIQLVAATGVPETLAREVRELHCPMFREGQGGGSWLQPSGPVRNPYFGSVMLECFDRERALPVTRTAGDGPPAQDGSGDEHAEREGPR